MDINGNIFIVGISSGHKSSIASLDYNGNLRWQKIIDPSPLEIWAPLACDAEGKVYFGCTDGTYYYCYSNGGEQLWNIPLNSHQADFSPAFGSDGSLYIGVQKGNHKTLMIAIKDNPSSIQDFINDVFECNFLGTILIPLILLQS